MKAVHSWTEYQYSFSNANDNNKMWMRNDEQIYQLSNGMFGAGINGEWFIDSFNSFEEAQSVLIEEQNDNTLQ